MDQNNSSPHLEVVHNCILPVLIFLAFTLPVFSYGEGPIAHDSFNFSADPLRSAESGKGWKGPWKTSAIRPATLVEKEDLPTVVIQGTGERNNPLRRELAEPFRDKELFVRFQFRYDPPEDSSEFFVLTRSVDGPQPALGEHIRRTALLLGCAAEHLSETVYAEHLNIDKDPIPTGTSCRLCERQGCLSRAEAPVTRPLGLDEMTTGLSVFDFN